ncbi:MAG: tetratricopeptide repeat protein [Cyclobacteriaceae bacterium]|nr:tetratricopeptide repeat protein [Cyclobacteriaceae bacterium]
MEESEIIDKYLKGELDGEQLANFSKALQTNNELQKKLALRNLIIAGISQSYSEELKFKLADFDRSLETKKRFQFSWKVAAVFAILIISGSIFYFSIQKPNPYDFDIVEPGLPNAMGANNTIERNNAMNIFKAGDYEASGQAFEKLLSNNPKNDTLLYFAGLCNFRTTETETAIQKWSQIESASTFFAKTEYRLAIAYWSIGDKKGAIELLQRIKSEQSNSLNEQAQKVLESLN